MLSHVTCRVSRSQCRRQCEQHITIWELYCRELGHGHKGKAMSRIPSEILRCMTNQQHVFTEPSFGMSVWQCLLIAYSLRLSTSYHASTPVPQSKVCSIFDLDWWLSQKAFHLNASVTNWLWLDTDSTLKEAILYSLQYLVQMHIFYWVAVISAVTRTYIEIELNLNHPANIYSRQGLSLNPSSKKFNTSLWICRQRWIGHLPKPQNARMKI